jgi:Ras of Complex, Roc, domain of DAPkinase
MCSELCIAEALSCHSLAETAIVALQALLQLTRHYNTYGLCCCWFYCRCSRAPKLFAVGTKVDVPRFLGIKRYSGTIQSVNTTLCCYSIEYTDGGWEADVPAGCVCSHICTAINACATADTSDASSIRFFQAGEDVDVRSNHSTVWLPCSVAGVNADGSYSVKDINFENCVTADAVRVRSKAALQFQVALFGNSGVGKTSILNRLFSDHYWQTFIQTIGIDFKVRVSCERTPI